MNELFPILDLFSNGDASPLLMILALALPILPNLWCIWHAYGHEFSTPAEKYGWMLAGVFVPVLGGVVYLLFGWRRTRGLADWAKPRKRK
ncbi:PLD nuclease N-terminal domain-containing protein [Desulfovibrio mangrovi]|uniref:PLD nuclease N-terminal domain-containing protein n=1 Tax=Desulfovibrio mangrovi TaxID=2976983 RepID=UPI003B847C52